MDDVMCHECGKRGPINEFHPHLFCVLYKAGISDPRRYLEAAEWSYTPGESDIPYTIDSDAQSVTFDPSSSDDAGTGES